MSKTWHDRFLKLDVSKAKAAAQAFRVRLEDIQGRLAAAEREQAELEAQAPALEAAFEESLLGDDSAQAAAQAALEGLFTAKANCERKITAIRDTLNRERQSPELQKLAGELWNQSASTRAALLELFPEAQAELAEAQEAYLKVVARIGKVGTQITRLETVMNKAAGPFLKEKRYQTSTPTPGVTLDPHVIQAAYDPGRTLEPTINPDALNRPRANAETALAVLRGE
jgi:hypothetical protein